MVGLGVWFGVLMEFRGDGGSGGGGVWCLWVVGLVELVCELGCRGWRQRWSDGRDNNF